MKEFYIDLPSNSSLDFFPKNQASNFTTRFAKALDLDEGWSCSIVELSYPAFAAVQGKKTTFVEYSIELPKSDENNSPQSQVFKFDFSNIPHDNFGETFANQFNQWAKTEIDENHIAFKADNRNEFQVNFPKSKYDTNQHLFIPNHIAHYFGFSNNSAGQFIHLNDHTVSDKTPTEYTEVVYQRESMQVFVYLDCIGFNYVGDTTARLLRTFALHPNSYQRSFQHLMYKPLSKTHIETIEVNIRDETGRLVAFENKLLNLTLHFKKL